MANSLKTSGSLATPPRHFRSPMPKWADEIGPRYIPFWQTALAALAALASITFAWLLYTKL